MNVRYALSQWYSMSKSKISEAIIRMVIFAILSLCSSAVPVRAELPRPVETSVFIGPPEYRLIRLLPDGKSVSYMYSDSESKLHGRPTCALKQKSIETGQESILAVSGIEVEDYVWHQDCKRIFARVPIAHNSQTFHLWIVDTTTGEARDLTPFRDVGFDSWMFSPTVPDEVLVTMRMRHPAFCDIYRINVESGAVKLDTVNPGDCGPHFGSDWIADHKLQVKANIGIASNGGFIVRCRNSSADPWEDLLTLKTTEVQPQLLDFSSDGKRLRMYSSGGSNTLRLIELDPRTEKQTVLAEDKTFDVWSALSWRGKFEGYMTYGERGLWHPRTPEFAEDLKKLQSVEEGEIGIAGNNKENDYWLVCYSTSVNSGSYYGYDRKTRTAKYLFDERPAITRGGLTLSDKRPVHIETSDKQDLLSYLSLPQGVKPEKLPCVLLVHGGPESRDIDDYEGVVQWLTNRGYAVLQPNYRGSSGFGKAFLALQDRQWGARQIDDLLDAKDWLVREGIADPARCGLMGSSHGGYMTLCTLAFKPGSFRCGISISGFSSLKTKYEKVLPEKQFYLPAVERSRGRRVGDDAFLRSRSPLYFADRVTEPVLLWHGRQDKTVNCGETEQIEVALRKYYKPVTAVYDPNAGHCLPDGESTFWLRVEELLATVLGGRILSDVPGP